VFPQDSAERELLGILETRSGVVKNKVTKGEGAKYDRFELETLVHPSWTAKPLTILAVNALRLDDLRSSFFFCFVIFLT
jgi:hypothetical protein